MKNPANRLTLRNTIESDFLAELVQIQAGSIGRTPLDECAYIHVDSERSIASVVEVAGLLESEMNDSSVLWAF
jgi:hypothetical protein